MTTDDVKALARELRRLGYLHAAVEPECADVMCRAAAEIERLRGLLAERDAMLAEAIGVFGIRFDGAICPFCSGREEYNDHKPDCLVTRIRALGIGEVKGDG